MADLSLPMIYCILSEINAHIPGHCLENISLACLSLYGFDATKHDNKHHNSLSLKEFIFEFFERLCMISTHTVYVPIDAHCASADLRVRVYFFFKFKKKIPKKLQKKN